MFNPLYTERLLLRKIQEKDLPIFLGYRNDPGVSLYQLWADIREEEAKLFIEEQIELRPGLPGVWFQLAICLRESDEMIGDCGVKVSGEDFKQAEIGFTLSRKYQGRGYGREAVACVLDFVFEDLKLHRVIGITDTKNQKSIALLEGLGFRREGHFIQNVWVNGKWGDEFLFALLADEWLGRQNR